MLFVRLLERSQFYQSIKETILEVSRNNELSLKYNYIQLSHY